ncbi:hypothetical protein F3Y22_tig00116945pilonHSYRG00028 [Hibiscus syriacus]|uniref:BURP domain-containing protein n=1 Tax=Hibiscus syriacus TaxID=106335 RepID=A0A6A2WN17_HIBSY|nr:BURP domain-containing protein 17-like [Hibiscus syriacus]KAE8660881.1 hypothetical protein F3Y22_tig00116945pilonHSYRG00028 [Hibiscus syriacus]
MGNEFVSCSLVLVLLITLAPGNVAGSHGNVLRLPTMDGKEEAGESAPSNSGMSMGMMMRMGREEVGKDPGFKVFFLMKDVQVGKTIPVNFPHLKETDPSRTLPRKTPTSLPFSLKALPFLLRFFSIPPASPQALGIEKTLTACETERPGEYKACITSVDSLIDFVGGYFGSDVRFEILKTSASSNSSPLIQNYTVFELKEKTSAKSLPCHNLPYPYPVFYCHILIDTTNRMFKVILRGENGDLVDAVLVCHMDTTKWNRNYFAFRQLGVERGTTEACHFFPAYDLAVVLVPK